MSNRVSIPGASLVLFCAVSVTLAAQEPRIASAQLTRQPGSQLA